MKKLLIFNKETLEVTGRHNEFEDDWGIEKWKTFDPIKEDYVICDAKEKEYAEIDGEEFFLQIGSEGKPVLEKKSIIEEKRLNLQKLKQSELESDKSDAQTDLAKK